MKLQHAGISGHHVLEMMKPKLAAGMDHEHLGREAVLLSTKASLGNRPHNSRSPDTEGEVIRSILHVFAKVNDARLKIPSSVLWPEMSTAVVWKTGEEVRVVGMVVDTGLGMRWTYK